MADLSLPNTEPSLAFLDDFSSTQNTQDQDLTFSSTQNTQPEPAFTANSSAGLQFSELSQVRALYICVLPTPMCHFLGSG